MRDSRLAKAKVSNLYINIRKNVLTLGGDEDKFIDRLFMIYLPIACAELVQIFKRSFSASRVSESGGE